MHDAGDLMDRMQYAQAEDDKDGPDVMVGDTNSCANAHVGFFADRIYAFTQWPTSLCVVRSVLCVAWVGVVMLLGLAISASPIGCAIDRRKAYTPRRFESPDANRTTSAGDATWINQTMKIFTCGLIGFVFATFLVLSASCLLYKTISYLSTVADGGKCRSRCCICSD